MNGRGSIKRIKSYKPIEKPLVMFVEVIYDDGTKRIFTRSHLRQRMKSLKQKEYFDEAEKIRKIIEECF